jgi:protease-4
MVEEPVRNRSPLGLLAGFLLVLVLPLIVGLVMAPRVVPEPGVGVIRLTYDIDSFTAFELAEQLKAARAADDIKALVLLVNSPGGSAVYSEELFLDVWNTRKEMPVVASIDLLAASGAYYVAAAADEIYAKPSSGIGSIGVIAFLPDPNVLDEDILTTGPYKGTGGTRDSFMRQIEMAKFSFLAAVEAGRGERLRTSAAELSRAEIWNGVEALEMGLIDGLLSQDETIKRAAALAGLSNYEIVELFPRAFPEAASLAIGAYAAPEVDPDRLWQSPVGLPAGIYYRHTQMPGGR